MREFQEILLKNLEEAREWSMMYLFKMRTLEHTFRQDPAASEQQDISVTERKD